VRGHPWRLMAAAVLSLALVATACSSDEGGDGGGGGGATGDCATVDQVSLQLQWFIQSQFAGYFAAQDQGFYADQCLDVTIIEGGVDIVPQQQLADGAVDFALAWVPKALASVEAGANIVDIAQVFQRSGTLQVSFVDAGITSPSDFAGKTIGNWGFGNEYEIFAALGYRVTTEPSDYRIASRDTPFQRALLAGWLDAAVEIAPQRGAALRAWHARRLAHVDALRSELVVGHVDLVALCTR